MSRMKRWMIAGAVAGLTLAGAARAADGAQGTWGTDAADAAVRGASAGCGEASAMPGYGGSGSARTTAGDPAQQGYGHDDHAVRAGAGGGAHVDPAPAPRSDADEVAAGNTGGRG